MTDLEYTDLLSNIINWRKRGQFDIAHLLASDALKTRSDESSLWHTLGQIHTERGEWADCLYCYSKALDLINQKRTGGGFDLQYQTTALGVAQSAMRLGDFSQHIWNLWEVGRFDVSWNPWPGSTYWCGGRLGDEFESLLVQAEGGFGDIFMFTRWLPLLKSRFKIKKLGLTVFKSMQNFTDWTKLGVDEVFAVNEDMMDFSWKYSTSIMSLPSACGMNSWLDIPRPWLPDVNMDVPTGNMRIGLCWRAEQNSSPINTKSLPVGVAESIAKRLGNERECDIYSLSPAQKDLYNEGEFDQPASIRYEPNRMTDWRKTAEYILSMDFVVTVDTAVAHLTGILGVPCLVLLPKSSCWRWGTQLSFSHWYGQTTRRHALYRQAKPLAWADDVDQIVNLAVEKNVWRDGVLIKRGRRYA
jgi:hypothetical protein